MFNIRDMLTNAQIRQFWMLADIKGPTDCWNWTGNQGPTGYGRFRIGSRKVGAHRIALFLEGPPEPAAPRNHVLHGDNCSRLCVNPRHLRWGSNQENIEDKLRLKRQAHGIGNARAKLNDELVREIRNSHETIYACAKRLGISPGNVSMVRTRKTWAHVV
jgi:hypothetical protein